MPHLTRTTLRNDWVLVAAATVLSLLGLVTMHSFSTEATFFARQAAWIAVSLGALFLVSLLDARVFSRTGVVVGAYAGVLASLVLVLVAGTVVLGARNRFDLGAFALQPSDPAQLILVITLAKYFARRHLDIGQFRHIFVSGAYALVLCGLLFFEPDFGSAIIVFAIWFGMVLVAGISRIHLGAVLLAGVVSLGLLWTFGFADYQKARILTFLDPLADVRGSGYNAHQSVIAVGSGMFLGKGIGYGSQSKLEFLPEYETDFVFAAFAEEWGFVGVALLVALFGLLLGRIVQHARLGATNFETLVCAGIVVWFLAHVVVHIGMNVGLLPVTGTTIPFLSYGGSHLVTEFVALGLVLAMSRYERSVRRDELDRGVMGLEGV